MLFIILLESKEVWIIKPFLDMESHWERVERILADGLIIILHIHKEGFLIAKMVIIFDLVGQLDWVRIKGLDARVAICSRRSERLPLSLFLIDRRRGCIDLRSSRLVLRRCKRNWSYVCFLFFGNTGLTGPFYSNKCHRDIACDNLA